MGGENGRLFSGGELWYGAKSMAGGGKVSCETEISGKRPSRCVGGYMKGKSRRELSSSTSSSGLATNSGWLYDRQTTGGNNKVVFRYRCKVVDFWEERRWRKLGDDVALDRELFQLGPEKCDVPSKLPCYSTILA